MKKKALEDQLYYDQLTENGFAVGTSLFSVWSGAARRLSSSAALFRASFFSSLAAYASLRRKPLHARTLRCDVVGVYNDQEGPRALCV